MLDDQIFCPTCGANTEHALIRSGQENLVRCIECETVHSVQKERERLINLKVIVSKDEVSKPYYIHILAKEILRVGDDLLVDDGTSDVVMTQIASLETDRRVNTALAEAIKTVWARATDEVPLKISVFRNGLSHSLKITVPGDETLEMGEVRLVEGFKFRIVKIKLRGEGFVDRAEAKDIVRVWGREL